MSTERRAQRAIHSHWLRQLTFSFYDLDAGFQPILIYQTRQLRSTPGESGPFRKILNEVCLLGDLASSDAMKVPFTLTVGAAPAAVTKPTAGHTRSPSVRTSGMREHDGVLMVNARIRSSHTSCIRVS